MTTTNQAKKELIATQLTQKISQTNEETLRVNLTKFFADLEQEIQKELEEYWTDTGFLNGQLQIILSPIHEKHKEYYDLLLKHKLQEFKTGAKTGKRIVKRAKKQTKALKSQTKYPVKFTHNENNLFGTKKYTENRLKQDTFTATESTLSRVDKDINQILTEGYKSGLGINEVSRQIGKRFTQLQNWESKRIARTEIHTAQQMGILKSYEEMDVQYIQWMTAQDSRVRGLKKGDRADHHKLDGEIIRLGDKFSNNLSYAGDKTGKIEEWINCRCTTAPFLMPSNKTAPIGVKYFHEKDLIDINTVETIPSISTTTNNNLLQGEYEIYEDVDDKGVPLTVYKYENIELAFNKGSSIQFEELKSHIDSLPKIFETTNAERIIFHDYRDPKCGGFWSPSNKLIEVFIPDIEKEWRLNTFNHEFAHSIDISKAVRVNDKWDMECSLSSPKIYADLFWADNKLLKLPKEVDLNEIPLHFPTGYAGDSYIDFNHMERIFSEDFAESSMRYLNPHTHASFCREFPNRAKYLKELYGDPDFINSGITKLPASQRRRKVPASEENMQLWYETYWRDKRKVIDTRRDTTHEMIEESKKRRKEIRRKKIHCETEECEQHYQEEMDSIEHNIQFLEKKADELWKEWLDTFKKSEIKIFE